MDLVRLTAPFAGSAMVSRNIDHRNGVLLFAFYRQSSESQAARAEDSVVRAYRDLTDRYRFFVSGWQGGAIDGGPRKQLGNRNVDRLVFGDLIRHRYPDRDAL